jgi:thiamine pyrophosphate-dependent acetolactate synthase large subunit-like protein
VSGVRVEHRAELGVAIDTALASARPALLDVWIDPEAGRQRKQDPRVGFVMFSDLAPSAATARPAGGA